MSLRLGSSFLRFTKLSGGMIELSTEAWSSKYLILQIQEILHSVHYWRICKMATRDFLLGIANALLDVVQPLQDSLESPHAFGALLLHYGWQPPSTQNYLPD